MSTQISLSAFCRVLLCALLAATAPAAMADDAASGNASVHDAQNPLANIISIPFQNNTYFSYGPERKTANLLVFEPVIPIISIRIGI